MQEIIIRSFTPSDIETICQIAIAAWAPIYAKYRKDMGEEFYQLIPPVDRKEKPSR